jgi:SAM-dependent methyltransferase
MLRVVRNSKTALLLHYEENMPQRRKIMNKFFIERNACPACKSINKEQLLKLRYDKAPVREYLNSWYSYKSIDPDYLEGGHYTLNECGDCGLIYQEEILNESALVRLYNEWIDYEKVSERIRKTYSVRHYFNHVRVLVNAISYMGILPGALKVLDFGMGSGTWCHLVKGFGCDVYGAELSQQRIDYAEGIKVIGYSEIPDRRFDFINTEQVFEHLAEPLEMLIYLKQSLTPDGIIKISVPEGADIGKRLKAWDWERLKICDSTEKLQRINNIWYWEFPMGSGDENSLNAVAPLQHINCFHRGVLVRY